ncbi:hypothetical protein BBO99_00007818 [Phytophthora kernoviae]|uniref:Condensin complex subunit 2 n=2 Tax=Phytophthora kernoviae TaxID=325452 RepID=A0A421FIJ8_9STRA|nr:hypothetical protein G195_008977 [Phytophthora kernoviae 00238/432]KAG2519268.1 hypothetical protein JM16_007218 [Phytophthora kernoviae]KAG2520381.1 hypothetical protein JM18_007143 [Phytophthora kernoviae]RLN45383.1 hypothetical protein BBI17_007596 [Phytophthora kernoviae]RLN76102.1 hypothetical protein BBO99_00007818 [Phytophthora kernoviae]
MAEVTEAESRQAAAHEDTSDVEQYELTEDEDEGEEKESERPTDAPKHATGKRKRSLSQNDEEEIARRRRHRRSLAYQQRRRSLTSSNGKTGGSGGATVQPARSKQYISDMYSTIIKMSSENKINVKNSWSLHLIDHMEDILDSSKKSAEDAEDDTYNFQKASCTLDASIKIYSYRVDDTWNSSYKILENLSRTEQKHGVEDAGSDADENGRSTTRKARKTHARTVEKNLNNINLKAYDTECVADPLFHKMSQSFDEGGAKGMLLANLSVYDGCKVLLNSSDVSMVTRKPINDGVVKLEQVEEDSKEKLTSGKETGADTAVAPDTAGQTEKGGANVVDIVGPDEKNAKKDADAESKETEANAEKDVDENGERKNEENVTKEAKPSEVGVEPAEDVNMEDVQDKGKEGSLNTDANKEQATEKEKSSEEAIVIDETLDKENESADAPQTAKEGESSDGPRVAEKSDEQTDTPVVEIADKPAKGRISLSIFGNLPCIDQDVQSMGVCPPLYRMYDQLDEYYGDESRHKLGIKNDFLINTPVKGRRKLLEKQDAISMNLAGIMEGASEDESDTEVAEHDTSVDFGDDNGDYDGDEDGDATEEAEEPLPDISDDVDMEKETDVIDLAGSDDEGLHEDPAQENMERGPTAIDKESSLKSSAADFFRSKVDENLPDNYENNLFSQMIESALVRSATLYNEQEGEAQDEKNDYSYFDVKMLRNWAGPGHWKFPAVRKIQTKKQKEDAERDAFPETNGEYDDDGVAIKVEVTERPRKSSVTGVEKKTAILVDFFGEEPDLSRLKAPKSASSLAITKFHLAKQTENASDLVLPVDTHIEIGLFFRHFLKEKPRFFRRHGGSNSDIIKREGALVNGADSGDNTDDVDSSHPFTYNDDSAGFEGGYDDEDDEDTSGADDPGVEALYSVEGLVQADRVVEKVGVHFERFAKRVDVKKLKGSIWEHLEKKKAVKTDSAAKNDQPDEADKSDKAVTINESGKRPRELNTNEEAEDGDEEALDTTFENVVENVSGKVPSNVTVSFYFICVLHLANEKGLELVGQDDLRNFQIRKETE